MSTQNTPLEALGVADPETLGAAELVAALVDRFGAGLVLASSFQKEETVLLDMLLAVDPNAAVFALDTHVLFDETYAYWQGVEERYGITVQAFAGPSLGKQAAQFGPSLWETAPDRCCGIRKMEPLARALAGRDCWITGVRRDQSPTRANAPKFGWDDAHELWKANPLADWDDERCWAYIREHDLPYNALHDRGYASIGCTYCTMPGSGREGRWSGNAKTECGLHQLPGAADAGH